MSLFKKRVKNIIKIMVVNGQSKTYASTSNRLVENKLQTNVSTTSKTYNLTTHTTSRDSHK